MRTMPSYTTGSLVCLGCAAVLFGFFLLLSNGGSVVMGFVTIVLLLTVIASLGLGGVLGVVGIVEESTLPSRLQALEVAVWCFAGLLYVWLAHIQL